MSNESRSMQKQADQEGLLVEFYNNILKGEAAPSIEYQKKFLLQLLNTKIAQIEPKTNRNKRFHFILRIAAMFLSGVSTVLLGLKMKDGVGLSPELSNITLIITAAITFLTGLAVFWDIENYWVRNKIMLNKLKELRYEYVFFLAGTTQVATKDIKPFLDKFLSGLGDEYWETFLKSIARQEAVNGKPDQHPG